MSKIVTVLKQSDEQNSHRFKTVIWAKQSYGQNSHMGKTVIWAKQSYGQNSHRFKTVKGGYMIIEDLDKDERIEQLLGTLVSTQIDQTALLTTMVTVYLEKEKIEDIEAKELVYAVSENSLKIAKYISRLLNSNYN